MPGGGGLLETIFCRYVPRGISNVGASELIFGQKGRNDFLEKMKLFWAQF